jgi:hypothetical protein
VHGEGTKPKQRRRWLIAAGLLLIAAVSWWNWPRGDARFVGKWTVIDHDVGESVNGMWLRMNGSGWADDGREQMHFSWHASDAELVIGREYKGSVGRVVTAVAEALLKATGRTYSPGQMKFRVVSISPDRIDVAFDAGSVNLSLVRIPE